MSTNHTAAELLATLSQRHTMFTRLLDEESPIAKQALIDDVGLSQPTVNKVLAELDDWGLIKSDPDGVAPTLLAVLAWETYRTFDDSIAAITGSDDDPLWSTTVERRDVLQLVADRCDILDYVTATPFEKRDLVAGVDMSRSTVDRAIRALEVAQLVTRTSAGYTTTPAGQQAIDQYRTTVATIRDILAAQPVLVALPYDCSLQPAMLADAATEDTADAPPYYLPPSIRERIAAAERARIYLPVLAAPQLLDCCLHQVVQDDLALELLTTPGLFETLTTEFPRPLATMAATNNSSFTTSVIDPIAAGGPPFGLVLTDTDEARTVSLIAYGEQDTIQGTIHNDTDAAIQWAEHCYANAYDGATEQTAILPGLIPAQQTGAPPRLTGSPSERVALEAEGFIQLTPEYFDQRAPAPPATAWRTGFDLTEVHAGYAIDRETESDDFHQSVASDLIQRLSDGTDYALIGPPGSGKSTTCRTVACRWYEQGLGAVFYRKSDTASTFETPAVLSESLRAAAADGHVLVVVEDAVRADANAIFRVMRSFHGTDNVTFLLDARESEWADPTAFPTNARLDAYRTEIVETMTMPGLTEYDCKRLVQHFQETIGHEITISIADLIRGTEIPAGSSQDQGRPMGESQPAALLVILHRLTLRIDPLAGEKARPVTTLAEAVQRTYEALRDIDDIALDVGILVNLLNVAGIGVSPGLIYALADGDFERIRDALSTLEGQIIFERNDSADAAPYRAVHEMWSTLFLNHLLDSVSDHEARQRFGRCVTALLMLASNSAQRARIITMSPNDASAVKRIDATPNEWADTTIERLFHVGLERPGLAPLFGMTDTSCIELPTACSPGMEPRCAAWRGQMYLDGGHRDRAQRELTRAIELVTDTDGRESETDHLPGLIAQSYKHLGAVAFRRGEITTAAEHFANAHENYRLNNDRMGEATCLNNLGVLAGEQGDLSRAEMYYKRSLDIYREIDIAQKQHADTLSNLGVIAARRGDLAHAEDYFERSSTIFRELDNATHVTAPLLNLGDVTRQRGDLNRAEDYYKQGIDIARQVGHSPEKTRGILGLGQIAVERGDLDHAEEYVRRSLTTYREMEELRGRAWCRQYLGRIARKRGNLETAEAHLTAALTDCRESDDRYETAITLVDLGNLAHERSDSERARERLQTALGTFQEIGAIRDTIETSEQLAIVCEALGDIDAALEHCESAVDLAQDTTFIEAPTSVKQQRDRLIEHPAIDNNA
jgi:tetratricopeptide (TPR) repeat protein/predicted transcriptional regulator